MINKTIQDVITYFKSQMTGVNTYVEGEYPDVDIYKNPVTCYFIAPEFNFEELSNQSKLMRFDFEIYVIYQKDRKENMKTKASAMLDAIYSIVKTSPSLGSTVDYSMISEIKNYDGIEGSDSARGLYLKLAILKEI